MTPDISWQLESAPLTSSYLVTRVHQWRQMDQVGADNTLILTQAIYTSNLPTLIGLLWLSVDTWIISSSSTTFVRSTYMVNTLCSVHFGSEVPCIVGVLHTATKLDKPGRTTYHTGRSVFLWHLSIRLFADYHSRPKLWLATVTGMELPCGDRIPWD